MFARGSGSVHGYALHQLRRRDAQANPLRGNTLLTASPELCFLIGPAHLGAAVPRMAQGVSHRLWAFPPAHTGDGVDN
jgi:hypothetical protein